MKALKTTICCILALAVSISALTACRKNNIPASESAPESRPEELPSVSSDAESAESKDISAAESEAVDVSGEDSSAAGSAFPVTIHLNGRLFVREQVGFEPRPRPSIFLNDDGTYIFSPGFQNSHIELGAWTKEGNTVTLKEMNIHFIDAGYALIYIADGSADGSNGFSRGAVEDGDMFYLSSSVVRDSTRYVPDYNSKSALHADEFLEKLKAHGYHVGDTVETGFHTENIESVFNITPPGIAEENADLDIFCVYPSGFCFFMYKGEIYRYTFGGNHHFLVLWDYDGNGVKDLVSYDTFGSGRPLLGVFVKDLTTMESVNVITCDLLMDSAFSFDFDGKNIYIDGEKLTYSDGKFHCGNLLE